MREPSLRTSRLAIAGGLVAAAAVGAAGFYLGRTTGPREPTSPSATTTTAAPLPPLAPLQAADRVLDRADLLELAALAADAVSSGDNVPARVLDASGRRFELALPFGCSGEAAAGSEALMQWRYDEENEVLRLRVAVTRLPADTWGLAEASDDVVIEGFWVARPWSSSDECPPLPSVGGGDAAGSNATPDLSLAVAQFLGSDTRREASRQNRPFEAVQRLPRADFAAPRGFRLTLSGRISRVPGNGPVRCVQPDEIDQRPRCVVAVTLDEVRIDNPGSGEVIASWPIGRD